jgi:hypothetical protein
VVVLAEDILSTGQNTFFFSKMCCLLFKKQE